MLQTGSYPWRTIGGCHCRFNLDGISPGGKYLWGRCPEAHGSFLRFRSPFRMTEVNACSWAFEETFGPGFPSRRYTAACVWNNITQEVGEECFWQLGIAVEMFVFGWVGPLSLGSVPLITKWASGLSPDYDDLQPSTHPQFEAGGQIIAPGGPGSVAHLLYGWPGKNPF